MWLLQVLPGHRRGRLRQGCWGAADWAEEGLMAWCPQAAWVSHLRLSHPCLPAASPRETCVVALGCAGRTWGAMQLAKL